MAIGVAFCFGIVCTDTLDSLLVHRFLAGSRSAMLRAKRVWLAAVTVFALVVGAYQLAQLVGWKSPIDETAFSAVLVAALFCVYGFIVARPGADAKRER